jgi:secreted trypsin-like serine protease
LFFLVILLKLSITKAIVGVHIKQAQFDEFPSVVSLKYMSNIDTEPELDHVCTGILISRQDVITATHCFVYLQLNTTEIIVGSNDLSQGNKYFPQWWITYEDWVSRKNIRKRFKDNDIAIIRVNQSKMLLIIFITKLDNDVPSCIFFF